MRPDYRPAGRPITLEYVSGVDLDPSSDPEPGRKCRQLVALSARTDAGHLVEQVVEGLAAALEQDLQLLAEATGKGRRETLRRNSYLQRPTARQRGHREV